MRKGPVLLFAALLLGGCMPSTITILPEPDSATVLTPTQSGMVLVQVADTTPYGTVFPANQVTVAPKDVNASEDTKLSRFMALDAPGNSTQFFYAVLPANEYSISSIRSFHMVGEGYFSQFYPASVELGTFSVEPGKVTDLGVLALYVQRSGEDYLFKTARTETAARTMSIVSERNPKLMQRVENLDEPMGWHSDGKDDERQDDYRNAVRRQIVYGNPQISPAGELNFPSRLGVIVSRDLGGDWQLDAFDDDVEITAITTIDGRRAIVTELNEIYLRRQDSLEWSKAPTPDASGQLKFLGQHPTAGLFAVYQQDKAVRIWVTDNIDDGWTYAQAIVPAEGFFSALSNRTLNSARRIQGADYVAHGDHLYMALYSDLYRFDFTTQTHEALKPSNPASIQSRNGVITVVSRPSPGASRVSFDHGETWLKYRGVFQENPGMEVKRRPGTRPQRAAAPAAKIIGHPIFLDERRAYAIHEEIKGRDRSFLIYTENGGETWSAAPDAVEMPKGCGHLVLATPDELLLNCFLTGEFYRSTDSGASWQLDREVSDT